MLPPRPTAFLALSMIDSSDLSLPVSLSPAFCESDLVESGWTVAAALSRFSLAFSPRPFWESGLMAEEACQGWKLQRRARKQWSVGAVGGKTVSSEPVGMPTYLVGEVLSSSVRHVCD